MKRMRNPKQPRFPWKTKLNITKLRISMEKSRHTFMYPCDEPHTLPIKIMYIDHDEPRGSSEVEGLGKREDQWTEIVSWEPRVFVYHNFLSREECEYLINVAKPRMVKSQVVNKTGTIRVSKVRTSTGMSLRRGQDNIEKRIADYTFMPVENGEQLQVLHYEVGQKYEPHHDYFYSAHELMVKNGGQRAATVLMYLSDVEEGGETVFPNAKGNISSGRGLNVEMSERAKRGISVKPKMGDALLFWNLRPDGSEDPSSLHESCPVIRGDKWSCTKWLRVDEYKL